LFTGRSEGTFRRRWLNQGQRPTSSSNNQLGSRSALGCGTLVEIVVSAPDSVETALTPALGFISIFTEPRGGGLAPVRVDLRAVAVEVHPDQLRSTQTEGSCPWAATEPYRKVVDVHSRKTHCRSVHTGRVVHCRRLGRSSCCRRLTQFGGPEAHLGPAVGSGGKETWLSEDLLEADDQLQDGPGRLPEGGGSLL